MGRIIGFFYGVFVYIGFLGVFLYLIAFLANITEIGGFTIPKTIDFGPPAADSFFSALVVNFILLALFGVQHSVMARQGFKKWIKSIIPGKMERPTYILATVVLLVLLYWQWRPLPDAIWSVENEIATILLWSGFALGWVIVFVSTHLIDHWELFGLKQAFYHLQGKKMPPYKFVTPFFYKYVRHPLYVGWILTFWCTPYMSQGHLLFAGVWTGYILIAIGYEEKDLMAYFGDKYRNYRKQTPMLVPFLKPRKK